MHIGIHNLQQDKVIINVLCSILLTNSRQLLYNVTRCAVYTVVTSVNKYFMALILHKSVISLTAETFLILNSLLTVILNSLLCTKLF